MNERLPGFASITILSLMSRHFIYMRSFIHANQIVTRRGCSAGNIPLPWLIRDGNDAPRADSPLVCVKGSYGEGLVKLSVPDTEDVVPTKTRYLEECSIDTEGVPMYALIYPRNVMLEQIESWIRG